jgi:hypothetical protein
MTGIQPGFGQTVGSVSGKAVPGAGPSPPVRGGLVIATIFLVAAVALSGVLPLWLDEILQLMETRDLPVAQMIATLPQHSGSAPLGYLVQHAALRVTGYSPLRARIPSALFGAAAVFVTALVGSELGLKRGWLAAALFAVFPLTLRYATESRIYSQALFFSVLSTLIYIRLAKRPSLALTVMYWLSLVLAVLTQPFAIFTGAAHILWSTSYLDRKTAYRGAAAFGLAIVAFLPWYLWSRARWTANVAATGLQFSFSAKTPLMLFRELAGAGYWGSGLLLILWILAIAGRRPLSRVQGLLILSIVAPVVCVLAADAVFQYFIAARQFLWVLPAAAILAMLAGARSPRTAFALYTLLALVCVWLDIRFFTSPHEDWQAAAGTIAKDVKAGACLAVAPSDQAVLYQFFEPQLREGGCEGSRAVLVVTPYSTAAQRGTGVAGLNAGGYRQENEAVIGKSEIIYFRR